MSPPVVCPRCKSVLTGARCAGCGASWSGPLGILDLSPAAARDAVTDELLERAETGSVEDLLRWFQPGLTAGRSAASSRVNVRYAESAVGRSEGMVRMFSSAAEAASAKPLGGGVALDLGCGMGGALVALARRFEWVIGLDANWRQLAFAARRIRDFGLENVTLVHGTASTLPVPAESLDAIVALNVLEHLVDGLESTLIEVRRTLRQGGVFCADSRNRYDLFFPEPHVHLRLVGCLPRRVQGSYVRWRTGRQYSGTRLLSSFEAQTKVARHVGPVQARMAKPSAFGKPPRADGIVAAVDRVPMVNSIARALYPSMVLVAHRR